MKPDLRAFLLADRVYRDVSGKWIIAGTFNCITLGEVQRRELREPDGTKKLQIADFETSGSSYLYISLGNVRGKVPLTVRFVSLFDHEVLLQMNFEVERNSPLDVVEFAVPFPGVPHLPLRQCPGDYAIELLYQDEPIAVHRFSCKRKPSEGQVE